jgi:hypothetical protein
MGLLDYVRCDAPLPDGQPTPPDLFQTKDFDAPYMEHYTITAEGRLIAHWVRYEEVPLAERPYPNDTGFLKWVGSVRVVHIVGEDLYWHGYLNFYGGADGEWREFNAKFTDGQLVSIEQVFDNTPGQPGTQGRGK